MRSRPPGVVRARGTVVAVRARLAPLAALLVLGAALPSAASAADATRATCHGLPVTTTKSAGLIIGTPQRDVIRATGPADIRAGAGDDVICGSRGIDAIRGGAGHDVILAGGGADRVWGGRGRDRIFGEGGSDRIDPGPGRDAIVGGAGRETIVRQTGDLVLPGTFAVSVVMTEQDVAQMDEAQLQVGLSLTDATPIPIASTAWPAAQVGFALGGYGVVTANAPIEIGETPEQIDIETAQLGSSWASIGPGLLEPGDAPSQPGSITVANESPGEIAIGLTQWITPFDGEQTLSRIAFGSGGVTEPFSSEVLTPTGSVAVYQIDGGMAGAVVPVLPASTGYDRLSPASPTAAFAWSPSTRRFSAD
jgi:hypothetical protein